MTKAEYRAYLQTDHWQHVRTRALERAAHRCQVCNASSELDVHHRTYVRLGAEADGDLTVLCRDCHGRFHDAQDSRWLLARSSREAIIEVLTEAGEQAATDADALDRIIATTLTAFETETYQQRLGALEAA